jgi:MoaA/NifB/PqqE/SkfB family radical SAM enzyme
VNRIDALKAPLFVSWQLTRDCDLACLHCCTESAPGKRLRDELDADEALKLADQIVGDDVPYVMLCGGEPLVVPHFLAVAERLGAGGVRLKIETNGQRLDRATVDRLARLPIRSVQISLDADTEDVYQRQRPGGSLAKVHAACRAVRDAGLPLEVTFAPTRVNIDHLVRVIERARELGAFRLSTGKLMRIGTAARLWDRLEPDAAQYQRMFDELERQAVNLVGVLELCYVPKSMGDGLRMSLAEPPATLLVLPNGWVKVAAALPQICADLRRHTLQQAWQAYGEAWRDGALLDDVRSAADDEARHAAANTWQRMPMAVIHRTEAA